LGIVFRQLGSTQSIIYRVTTQVVKLTKAWCAWCGAVALQQGELPADFEQILHGPLLRLVKRLIRTGSQKRRARIGWSLTQVKRACAPISADFISEKLADHAKILSAQPEIISSEILDEMSGIVDRVLSGFSWSTRDLYKSRWPAPVVGFEPSTSASAEETMEFGGSAGFLFSRSHSPFQNDELLYVTDDPAQSGCHQVMFSQPDYTGIVSDLLKSASNFDSGKGAEWVVQGILEPLKLRIITKGPAATQWLGKGLQLKLHDYLRELPQFSFIGHPVDEGTLAIFLQQCFDTLGKEVNFVSGDYSAATDRLNINVTLAIFDVICARLRINKSIDRTNALTAFISLEESNVLKCLRSLLDKGVLTYRGDNCPEQVDIASHGLSQFFHENCRGGELVVPQRNGQLMGSILSFPMLCLANFACIVMAANRMPPSYFGSNFERSVYWKNLWSGMCQINGDDILFPVSGINMYNHWSSFLRVFGFVKSLGKNWFHPRIFTINSQLFYINSVAWQSYVRPIYYTEIKYFQAGLLIGQHKVVGRTGDRVLPMSSVLQLVLDSSCNPKRSFSRFLFYNREWVRAVTQNGMVNIGLPIYLGGLGVNLRHFGIDLGLTRLQRCVAQHAYDILYTKGMTIQEYSHLVVHLKETEMSLEPQYTPLSRSHGRVNLRLKTMADASEEPLEVEVPNSIGPLTHRKPVRSDDSKPILTGVRLFRKILKEKIPKSLLKRDFDFDLFEVISLQRVLESIGSTDQEAKTVQLPTFDGLLNSSVLRKYIITFPSWVSEVQPSEFCTTGMSRDCTASGGIILPVYQGRDKDRYRRQLPLILV